MDVTAILLASVQSVGSAMTITAVGIYMRKKGMVTAENKKVLAVINKKISMPLFLFTKLLYCPQNGSDDPCPDIVSHIADVWLLLIWPIVVVGIGLLAGWILNRLVKSEHSSLVLAVTSLGNSTALPVTLLSAIHSSMPRDSALGATDPTLFLSVYLLLFPVIQWSSGSYLLKPKDDEPATEELEPTEMISTRVSSGSTITSCVAPLSGLPTKSSLGPPSSDIKDFKDDVESQIAEGVGDGFSQTENDHQSNQGQGSGSNDATASISHKETSSTDDWSDEASTESKTSFFKKVWGLFQQCFLQPPIIGAVLGITVAAMPKVRALFVDTSTRESTAPLQWLFDALYAVGLSAIPINMIVLGVNLAPSLSRKAWRRSHHNNASFLSWKLMFGMLTGKMLVLPATGMTLTWILKAFVLSVPKTIEAPFYLTLMMVCLTPTASNVMVMAELSSSNETKEGLARALALQYFLSPIILTASVMVAVGIATDWSL